MVAELCDLDLDAPLPAGVEVRAAEDAEAVAVWVEVNELAVRRAPRWGWSACCCARWSTERPRDLGVIAYADGEPVSAGRIEFNERSEFASLWGGGTLAEWRRRGIYRATVLERARLAHERGYRFLQVDALPTSRPILERLGFVQLTTTRPYVPHGRRPVRAQRAPLAPCLPGPARGSRAREIAHMAGTAHCRSTRRAGSAVSTADGRTRHARPSHPRD